MYVRSQNKKILGEFTIYKIPPTLGKKSCIMGYTNAFGSEVNLGEFENQELALREIENIQNAMVQGIEVYQVK